MLPSETIVNFFQLLLLYLAYRRLQERESTREYWVHPMNENREETSLMRRVNNVSNYPQRFHEQFRMSPGTFNYILDMIKHRIKKQDTQMRKAIDVNTRLAVTLYHLATGANHRQLAFMYALGRKTVSDIIYETCTAIDEILSPVYLKPPTCHEEWRRIAQW